MSANGLREQQAIRRPRMPTRRADSAAPRAASRRAAPAQPPAAPRSPLPQRRAAPPRLPATPHRAPPAAYDPSSPFGGAVRAVGAPRLRPRSAPQCQSSPRPRCAPPAPAPAAAPRRSRRRRPSARSRDVNCARCSTPTRLDEFDDLDLDDEIAAPATPARGRSAAGAPVARCPPRPVRRAGPRQPAAAAAPGRRRRRSPTSRRPRPSRSGTGPSQLNVPIDRAEPFDQLLSRGGVSHGVPTTTNALILPSLPDHGPARQPAREQRRDHRHRFDRPAPQLSARPAFTRARSTPPTSTACSTRSKTAHGVGARSRRRGRSARRARPAR